MGTIRSVSAMELTPSGVYMVVSYLDDDLLVPIVETFVFLGRDVLDEGSDRLFFQDARSFFEMGAFSTDNQDVGPLFSAMHDNLENVFDVKNAAVVLAQCAARRDRR